MLQGNMTINKQGHLVIGGCDTVELARTFGTPLYVYDEEDIRARCWEYRNGLDSTYSNSSVVFAGKAFLCQAMCRLADEEGLGLDVVSGGELYTALKAGFPMDKVLFHGNNKSKDELEGAIKAEVGRIVVDNSYELSILDNLCKKHNKTVNILLRVTPGVEAHTHEYIQTGQEDSKFGMGIGNGEASRLIKKIIKINTVELKGLHCHIGSQIFEIESFKAALNRVLDYCVDLKRDGIMIKEVDLGGGLGIRHNIRENPVSVGEFSKFIGRAMTEGCKERGLGFPKLIIEPGRSLVGEPGTTLYTAGSIKKIPGIRKYVAVDGGMGDNPRVSLYGAVYEGMVANKANEDNKEVVTIAGKCCESGDILIKDINLPPIDSGDTIAIFSTGAYNYSMASNYNRIPRPAAIFVKDGKADLIIGRETYDDLMNKDTIPERLKKTQDEVACAKKE